MSSRRIDLISSFCKEFTPAASSDTVTIYFLIWRGEIAYVGQTVNLGQRLALHRAPRRRKTWLDPRPLITSRFERVLYFEVPASDAAAYEGALIRNFNPRWSKRAPADVSRDNEILLRLGITPNERSRAAFAERTRRIWYSTARRSAAAKRRERSEFAAGGAS